MLPEALLQYVWHRDACRLDHRTTHGLPVEVLHQGTWNTDSGPDFLDARLRIDGLEWVGHIEVHIRSAEWYAHKHEQDPAYEAVALHVVWEEDRPVFYTDGSLIPCVELSPSLSEEVCSQYSRWQERRRWIPCAGELPHADLEQVDVSWWRQLVEERLRQKSYQLLERLEAIQGDWEALSWEQLCRSWLLRVNAEPGKALAERVPVTLLRRYAGRPAELEALLLGQAGMLASADSKGYDAVAARRYVFLRQLYQLQPLPVTVWRYGRLRPSSFPDRRLRALARWLSAGAHPLRALWEVRTLPEWETVLGSLPPGAAGVQPLGRQAVHMILINTVALLWYAYGIHRRDTQRQSEAVALLEALPAEQHTITRSWKRLGIQPRHAADSQALLQLLRQYCKEGSCMRCAIGQQLLGLV